MSACLHSRKYINTKCLYIANWLYTLINANCYIGYMESKDIFDKRVKEIQIETVSIDLLTKEKSFISQLKEKYALVKSVDFLVDYSSNKYPYLGEKIRKLVDYKEIETRGIDYTSEAFHPDDWKTYNLYLFPQMIAFLKSEPKTKWDRFEFIYNYRIKNQSVNNNFKYNHVFQRSIFFNLLRDDFPILSAGTVDHSSLPDNCNKMYLKILRNDVPVYQQTFISIDTNLETLTPSELKVLRYRAQGHSYNDIGTETSSAQGTISNHLKNLKAKTGCYTQDDLKILAVQLGL